MASSTMAGVDLPPWRPSLSPPAYKREPSASSFFPTHRRPPLPLSQPSRRSLLASSPSAQLRLPLAGRRDLLGARCRHHLLCLLLLFPVHTSVEHEDHGNNDDTDDPVVSTGSSSSPANSVNLSPLRPHDPIVLKDQLFIAVDAEDFVSDQEDELDEDEGLDF